jgi:hypothetical protein
MNAPPLSMARESPAEPLAMPSSGPAAGGAPEPLRVDDALEAIKQELASLL